MPQSSTISGTYSSGDIPTNYGSYSSTCNGPATVLNITLPASGGPWIVTAVDVTYDMLAQSSAWKSEQRSKIFCQNTSTGESNFISGSGSSGGTQYYSRTGLNIANGSFVNGTVLTFEMQAYRTWGGSGCNTTYNKIVDGTWSITVHYENVPTCPAPSNLNLSIFGGSLYELGWTENGTATSWDIELGPSGFSPSGTPTDYGVSNSYIYNGLSPNTSYDYYVRSDCGGGDLSSWTGPYTFKTLCGTASMPYSENFDLLTANNSSISSCQSGVDVSAVCWTNETGDGQDWVARSSSTSSSSTGPSSDHTGGGNYMYTESSSCYSSSALLTTVTIDASSATFPTLGFWYHMYGSNMGSLSVDAFYNGSWNNNIWSISGDQSNSWNYAEIAVTAAAGYSDLKFRFNSTTGTGYLSDIAIDDISVVDLTCPDPSALTASNITSSQAELSWTENGTATQWDIEIGNSGFSASGTPSQSSVSNSYVYTGLNANTDYEYYVRSDCGGGDYSNWVGPYSFSTPCASITTFPHCESFDGTSENCWTILNNNADSDSWNDDYTLNPRTGSESAMMYTDFNNGNNDDYLISPPIELTGNQELSFWYRVQSSGEPNNFEVLLSTTGTNPADFTNTLLPDANYSNTAYEEQKLSLSAYTSSVYIAFHIPNGGLDGFRLYIDDICISDLPSCPDPINLNAVNILHNQADLSWTEYGSATVWDIEFGLDGFTPTGIPTDTGISSNPYTYTGLTPSTGYQYYVRSSCGGSDYSNWVGPYSFSTSIYTGLVYIGNTSFTNLKSAFDAINSGTYTGDILITIGNADGQSIIETSEAVLNKSGSGSANYSSITVQPGAKDIKVIGAISGSCCIPSGVVKLNQAENVVFDGRLNGTGTEIDLTIENTETGSYSSGFVFFAASNDTLRYTHVKSAVTGTCCGNGTISIADNNTSGGSGSSNNLIEFNEVSDSEGNIPMRAIAGKGASGRENNNNLIRNNSIYNFQEFGIYLGNGSSDGYNRDWVISDNIIYQSVEFSNTSTDQVGISIGQKFSASGSELGSFVVSGNIIGGDGAGGDWKVSSSSTRRIAGIAINTSTTLSTSVFNNTIANFDVKTTNTSTDYGMFTGILVSQGKASVKGNTVGDTTQDESIKVSRNNTSTGGFVSGIQVRSTADFENVINNNTVSGISITEGTGIFNSFYGIRNTSSTTYPADSIYNNNVSYFSLDKVNYAYGIYAQGAISKNQVRDIGFNGASSFSTLTGISWFGGDITGTGSLGVESNEVILGLNRNGDTIGLNDAIIGIEITRGDAEVYYNSVLIRGASTSTDDSYGIELPNSGMTIFKNNMIYNERTGPGEHYAVYSTHTNMALLNSSNNAYITGTSSNNYLGYWGANISDLTTWENNSGERNSISTDNANLPVALLFPLYATENTLDVAEPSWLEAGVSISNSVVDINNVGRDAVLPTIGAYEQSNLFGALPIELLAFEVECQSGFALLKWTTVAEVNNDYFTLEKSIDGNDFYEITRISGAGNSTEMLSYIYEDILYNDGNTIYYRLKQTDYDGTEKYFDKVALECQQNTTEKLQVYPNPFSDKIIVEMNSSDKKETLVLMDITGRKVMQLELETNTYQTEILLDKNLKPGAYFLFIESNIGKTYTKLIKVD